MRTGVGEQRTVYEDRETQPNDWRWRRRRRKNTLRKSRINRSSSFAHSMRLAFNFFSSHIFRGFQLSADRSPCVSVSNRKRCNRQVHAPHFTSMVYVLLWAPSFIVCFDFRPNKWEKRREKQINIKFIRDTLYRTRHCSRRQHTHTRHIHNYQNGHIARLTVYARYFIKIKFYEKSKIKFWEIFPHLLLLCSESLRFGAVCVWVCVFFFCFRSCALFSFIFYFYGSFFGRFSSLFGTCTRGDTTSPAACAHHDFLNDYV